MLKNTCRGSFGVYVTSLHQRRASLPVPGGAAEDRVGVPGLPRAGREPHSAEELPRWAAGREGEGRGGGWWELTLQPGGKGGPGCGSSLPAGSRPHFVGACGRWEAGRRKAQRRSGSLVQGGKRATRTRAAVRRGTWPEPPRSPGVSEGSWWWWVSAGKESSTGAWRDRVFRVRSQRTGGCAGDVGRRQSCGSQEARSRDGRARSRAQAAVAGVRGDPRRPALGSTGLRFMLCVFRSASGTSGAPAPPWSTSRFLYRHVWLRIWAGTPLSSGPAPGTWLLLRMSWPSRDCALVHLEKAVREPQPPAPPWALGTSVSAVRAGRSSREHAGQGARRLEAPFAAFTFLCSLDPEISAPGIGPGLLGCLRKRPTCQ